MLDEMLKSLSKVELGKLDNVEIQSLLKKKLATSLSENRAPMKDTKYWSAESFGLDKVSLFNKLEYPQQDSVLAFASTMRLEEAYHIEYAGMSYAAKMSLLAQSVEEQRLYSIFAAEEAKHFSYITQFFSLKNSSPAKPFVLFLNDTIARGNRMPLIFIVQVLLEGWGLDHYQQMTGHCLDNTLKGYLSEIVADEASHHGSGVLLFDESKLDSNDFEFIIKVMTHFLNDVRVGPSGLMDCLFKVTGLISKEDQQLCYRELGAFDETSRKLNLLKKMMLKVNANKTVSALEQRDLFTPNLAC
jgi:hypothetical protein